MQETPQRPQHHAEVASHIPGRLRVRLHRRSRHQHTMARLKDAIAGQEGIHGVEVNHAAGSLTVRYDPQAYQETAIWGVLQDLDVILGTTLEAPQIEAPAEGSGHSTAATTLTGALDDLDKRAAALTGHTLNLRTLFPLTLAGIGAWRIWEQGLMFEAVPGWLLLWLAFDAFVKLNVLTSPTQVTVTDGPPG
jgi:hypothetical protein